MQQLENNLTALYRALVNKEFIARKIADSSHADNKLSVMNLVRYVTLRNQDLRNVHDHLSELGISSLRSCEAYVMHNVISVLGLVKSINGSKWHPDNSVEMVGYKESKKRIKRNTARLFGTKVKGERLTKVMVTLPVEAAYDIEIIRGLMQGGMDIARINLSHGTEEEWKAMVDKIELLQEELNTQCSIYMDLSGPKIRTGSISSTNAKGELKPFIKISTGDHLILTSTEEVNTSNIKPKSTRRFPKIPVSLNAIIKDADVGDRIFFDDGLAETKVIKKRDGELEVIVLRCNDGFKLKSEKGINLPDTVLSLPSLTNADIRNMPFVMKHADIVGYSFVRTVADIKALHQQIDKYKREDIGVVLKIENQESFDNLPILLIEAMKKSKVGVMIARGDLAVEIGPVRIAEVQDQIMWICEAAHVPVIWATQVLESMAKTGKATRAEITDAAKSARAECVMLNKGTYIQDTLKMLSKILAKMEGHTSKKKSVMRALKLSEKNIDRMGEV